MLASNPLTGFRARKSTMSVFDVPAGQMSMLRTLVKEEINYDNKLSAAGGNQFFPWYGGLRHSGLVEQMPWLNSYFDLAPHSFREAYLLGNLGYLVLEIEF